MKIAIVGAGIAGVTCGGQLHATGAHVSLYEKSRGAGGRMATRRTADGLRFDHGAQYFTLRDRRFLAAAEVWKQTGLIAPWPGTIVEISSAGTIDKTNDQRFVAVPAMNALCKHLAEGLTMHTQAHVGRLERHEKRWELFSTEGDSLGTADWVISSAPAGQTAALMRPSQGIVQAASVAEMLPCWGVMIAPTEPLDAAAFDGAFVNTGPLRWVARNSSKPGREAGQETWVLHASAEWSNTHWEKPPEWIAQNLWETFCQLLELDYPSKTAFQTAHRWRYALVDSAFSERFVIDPQLQLAACGDWCGGPRVEGAYLSGLEVAEQLLQTLSRKAEI